MSQGSCGAGEAKVGGVAGASVLGHRIDCTVRSDPNIANASLERYPLLVGHAVAFKVNHDDTGRNEPADQEGVLPLRKLIAAVERHAGGSDDRIPVVSRLLEPVLLWYALTALLAAVFDPVGDDGPAVVEAGLGPVELVTACRSVLHDPEPAVAVERGGLDVAVTVAPDLWLGIVFADEGIVFQRLTVAVEAENLAEAAFQVLRLVADLRIGTLTDPQIEFSLGPEDDARAVVQLAVIGRHLLEDDGDVLERASTLIVSNEGRPREGGTVSTIAGFRKGEEDLVGAFEVGSEGNVKQAALAARIDFRHPLEGGSNLPVG